MGVRPPAVIGAEIDAMAADPASGAWLLWTRTDARDAAHACRQAIECHTAVSGPYNITGPGVVLDRPTEELVADFFGDRTTRVQPLPGQTSPLSCARARDAFGYRPEYAWSESSRHPE
jgi:nucleoside-diphosphate-sugar epimerase